MPEPQMASRVDATEAATALLRSLRARHGELMVHQSGGCCDGSAPMCYPAGELLVGDVDVHLGDLDLGVAGTDGPVGPDAPDGDRATVPVWMTRAQHEYWKHTHLTIDVVPGRGAGFSLEAPEGVRFLLRSRLLTDDEVAALRAAGPL